MRARALVSLAVICAIGAASVPAQAAPPIPRVRFTVPHFDPPVPPAGRPLAETEWSSSSRLFKQRLESAGSPERLAVEEATLTVGRQRLREAAKACGEHAAGEVLEAQLSALASGQALPGRQQTHDALESGIDDCLSEVVPEVAAPARQELAGWVADEALPPVDRAVHTSATVDASITWPSSVSGTGVFVPDDEDSPFPWPAALVVGTLGGGALLLRARRRS